jgi:hypothetical protein
VERALSWLSCWRRLQVRWDQDVGRDRGFLAIQVIDQHLRMDWAPWASAERAKTGAETSWLSA